MNRSQIIKKPYTCTIRNLNFLWKIMRFPLKQESGISRFAFRDVALAIVWKTNCRRTRDQKLLGGKHSNSQEK